MPVGGRRWSDRRTRSARHAWCWRTASTVQWFLIIMTHLQQQLKQDQEDQTGLYNSEKKRLVERLAEQQVAAAGGVKV